MAADISEKQKMFCREYIIDINGKQAAIRAGYSAKTAEQQASRLLRNVKVQEEIQRLLQARNARLDANADDVLHRILENLNADLADLFDEYGNLKSVHEWPLIWRTGLVGGVEVFVERDGEGTEIGQTKKLKLVDRTPQISLMGKHVKIGAFADHMRHSGPTGGDIPVSHRSVDQMSKHEIGRMILFAMRRGLKLHKEQSNAKQIEGKAKADL